MDNDQSGQADHTEQALTSPRSNSLSRRDFSGVSLAVGNAATEALVAKARADTEARWIMAMRRPRNIDDVRQDILRECRRPGFADVAIYSVPRGEKRIEGLSIRFAEVAARCMGNMQPEVVTIYDDDTTRIVRVTVTDYESNVTWSKDLSIKKTVERKFLKKGQRSHGERENSYGERVYIVDATDDDVNTKEAAMVSKAVRTLILRIIPGHLQDEAFAICAAIAKDKDAKDPDGARIAMLDSFAGIGVKPSEIEEYLGHTTERMAPVEVDGLRRLFAAIRDGETSWRDALEFARGERLAAAKPAGPTSAPAATGAPAASAAPKAQEQAGTQPQSTPATKAAGSAKGGKGAAALKEQIKTQPTQPETKVPTSFDKAAEEARARDAARPQPTPEVPPDEPPPKDGHEDRACAGRNGTCGAVVEVEIGSPPGQLCYVCRQE